MATMLLPDALEVMTFGDVADHLLDFADMRATTSGRPRNVVRRAVQEAYRTIPLEHQWRFYEQLGRVVTVPQQTEGTIEYDHAGGANDRQVTLAGATWPADAERYTLRVGTADYRIESRISGTVVTLPEDQNPGQDMAAGTSYVLYRSRYSLPRLFRRMAGPVVLAGFERQLEELPPDQWVRVRPIDSDPGEPLAYTLFPSEHEIGAMEIELPPPPAEAATYEFVYERTPSPIRPFGPSPEYTAGTITIASGATVTGNGTAWTSRMVGTVMRFTSGTTAPTGVGGDNPFAEQRIVTAVGDAGSLTIDAALEGSYTGKPYSISDPLDIAPTMLTYLLSRVELIYARLMRYDSKLTVPMERALAREFALAATADRRHREIKLIDSSGTDDQYLVGTVDIDP